MKINEILSRLNAHGITIHSDETAANGSRVLVLAGRLPSIPFGPNRMAFYTLVLDDGQQEVCFEEREAIRRHMWHRTTDIFGDDEHDLQEDVPSENGNSHLHEIIEKDRLE